MLTYSKLGQCGRLGNQLWQIMSTVGIAGEDSVSFPRWEYERWFRFPDFFTEQGTVDVVRLHDDYLQNLEFVEDVRDLAVKWMTPSSAARLVVDYFVREYRIEEAAGVHVRRGDYAEEWRGHGMLDKDHYLANWPDGDVVVFTDDPEWCRENLPGRIVHEEDWVDFFLFSRTREKVISNSSFAWWAAFISDGDVTAPAPWFLNDDMNVYPEWWNVVSRAA